VFVPTLVDILLSVGAVGFFCFAIFLIARLVPIVSIHGTRLLLAEERRK
jgi:hypothetical protein